MFWIVPMLAIGGGALLLSRKARAKAPSVGGDGDDAQRDRDVDDAPVGPISESLAARAEHVRQLAFQIGAPPLWADTFALIARGESGGNPLRGLGITQGAPPWAQMGKLVSEANAACDVYDSGRKHVGNCGWKRELYCFGSGGLYAMLPMSGLKAFWNDPLLRCLHPWSCFDEKIATIMAAHFAHRLQLRSGYKGTVWSLRRGWGIPGKMSSAPADKLAKWRGHAQSIGLAPSILEAKLPPWKPIPASSMFVAIGADPLWLPEPELYYERQVA